MNETLSYSQFRTGFTFKQIRLVLKREQNRKRENFEYMFVTRNTVLGRWRQIKLSMYEDYLSMFDQPTNS